MGSGMDQYLANQLTNAGIFEVVTDPKKADAILTDNVRRGIPKQTRTICIRRLRPYRQPQPAAEEKDMGNRNELR